MKTGINEALLLTIIMAAAIFFCRVFPFLFFRASADDKRPGAKRSGAKRSGAKRSLAFLAFVEKTVPPVAMTVLAFNALAGPLQTNLRELPPVLIAAAITALVHLWRRNPLISIFGGTAVFMALIRVWG